MKKRIKLKRFWFILALEFCVVALAFGLGLLARYQTRVKLDLTANKPEFSAQSVTISYVFKGTFEEDANLASNWSCGAQLTDPAVITELCKQLNRTIWEQTTADRAVVPYWRIEMDDAVVTLCRPKPRQENDYYLVYERGGEKTVWEMYDNRMQALSDTLDALTQSPEAELLQAVHIKRFSDGAEFDLHNDRLDAAQTVLQNVLQHTRCVKTELGKTSTFEVTFTLSDGTLLTLLYYPGGSIRGNWSKADLRGPMGFFHLDREHDPFPALFSLLDN